MDDLEFWRRCIADPQDRDETFLRKCRETPEHERLRESQSRLSQTLKSVFEQIQPPKDLEARIHRHLGTERRQSQPDYTRRTLAMAASVLLMCGLVWIIHFESNDLKGTVLAHIYSELDHLSERKSYSDEKISLILAEVGVDIRQPLTEIRYASTCHIREGDGAHLVMEGETGPVTILLMPGNRIKSRLAVSDKRFRGIIVPTPGGDMAMAIIGERREPVEAIEATLRSAIHWRA